MHMNNFPAIETHVIIHFTVGQLEDYKTKQLHTRPKRHKHTQKLTS